MVPGWQRSLWRSAPDMALGLRRANAPSFCRGCGSQSTDVDPPYQKGALSPTKLAQLLHLPESEQALLRKTEEDFYSESLEVGGGGVGYAGWWCWAGLVLRAVLIR